MLGSPPFLEREQEQGVHSVLGHVVDYHDMPDNIPTDLRWEHQRYVEAVRAGQALDRSSERLPCFWWDAQKKSCRHYQYRPKVCRDFYCGKARKATAESGEARGVSLRPNGVRQIDGQPLSTETVRERESG
jgi:Fe-S-cluster containining protein